MRHVRTCMVFFGQNPPQYESYCPLYWLFFWPNIFPVGLPYIYNNLFWTCFIWKWRNNDRAFNIRMLIIVWIKKSLMVL